FAIEDTFHNVLTAYMQEAVGTGGSGQRGIKGLTQMKMDAYRQALLAFGPEFSELQTNIKTQDSIIAQAKSGMEDKRKLYEASVKDNLGFLERNKALSDLSDEESSVFWSSFLISLLIILIEIGPVLSKLIMPIGPYDIALAKEELLQMAADENALREEKEIRYEKKKVFFEKQKEMSDELVSKLTNLQRKNIDEELEKWERGEWNPKDHRPSMDEVMRKIKAQYQFRDEDIL
ncbi:MAG: hypothetical protein JWM28_2263, partial [Chitinophagaceae bacterium]|nr:hypothetical protein [Chitinophagaceae bacterium]